jgi:hypothetical protein
MQEDGFHTRSLEILERLSNTEIDLGAFMISCLSALDFGMKGEPSGSTSPAKACLTARVVTSGIDLPIPATVEGVKKAFDFILMVKVHDPRLFGLVANLSCSG